MILYIPEYLGKVPLYAYELWDLFPHPVKGKQAYFFSSSSETISDFFVDIGDDSLKELPKKSVKDVL